MKERTAVTTHPFMQELLSRRRTLAWWAGILATPPSPHQDLGIGSLEKANELGFEPRP